MDRAQRKRAMLLAYVNGALWALGNGLGSTALFIYLVRELGAAGLGIGVALAAPHIAGVLRLSAPALVDRVGRRRNVCMTCYGGSAVLLAVIAQLAEPGRLAEPAVTLPLVVGLWCVYHLLEYVGTVLLWSWLGDIAPRRIRGRFIGVRERWMLAARILGMLAGGGFSWGWSLYAAGDAWVGYAVPACAAAALMMTAILPLARMADPEQARDKSPPPIFSLFNPLADPPMRWLLAFGIWFSLANGLTQSAQYLFPIVAFGLPLLARNVYTSGMRLGQAAAAPRVGTIADRLGNRRVLIAAQLVVAVGPLFFILAARLPAVNFLFLPLSWWCLGGAWVAWIAYVGLNVGLPNLMLKLAGPRLRASYVAWYFAVTGIVYGVSTIAGGALYEWAKARHFTCQIGSHTVNCNDAFFATGFLLRVLAVVWLLPICEEL